MKPAMLFIILSKKNLKANHNNTGFGVSTLNVVYNIVKEKSESKSQPLVAELASRLSCL